jgi:excisionase family DNA binding protein
MVVRNDLEVDMTTSVLPATYTIDEYAQKLGVGRNTAYEAAHRGEIPVIKIGKRLLVPRAAGDKMLEGEVVRRGRTE